MVFIQFHKFRLLMINHLFQMNSSYISLIFFFLLNNKFFIFSQFVKIQSSYGKDSLPESCFNWLENYFHSKSKLSNIPELCPNVTSKYDSFQENVWRTLVNHVHFGQTITYGRLASLSGSKNAARAVGSAMRRNPFQLIVPCHRVIRSNGVIGKYSGGERNNVKRWLLKHEQKK